MKDDLVDDPLDCDMINFEGATYGDTGGVCRLPNPANLGNLEFRYGSATISPAYGGGSWAAVAITFDPAFTSTLHVCLPVVTGSFLCPSGVNIDGNDYAIMVKDKTAAGCTVWIYREDDTNDCTVTFDYLAVGE